MQQGLKNKKRINAYTVYIHPNPVVPNLFSFAAPYPVEIITLRRTTQKITNSRLSAEEINICGDLQQTRSNFARSVYATLRKTQNELNVAYSRDPQVVDREIFVHRVAKI